MVVAKENKELGYQGRESITLTYTLLKTIPLTYMLQVKIQQY